MANLPVHLTQKKGSELYFWHFRWRGGGRSYNRVCHVMANLPVHLTYIKRLITVCSSGPFRPWEAALHQCAPCHGQSSRPPDTGNMFRTVLVVLPPAPVRGRRRYARVCHVMANLPVHLTQKKSSELYFRPLPSAAGGATPACATSLPIFPSTWHRKKVQNCSSGHFRPREEALRPFVPRHGLSSRPHYT
jgi:hypothetical protein